MSSEDVPSGRTDVPAAEVQRKSGVSLVWIVPILAAGIGAWLWWDAIQKRGPEVTIELTTAEGLEAGKTKIQFKSVEVGTIEEVRLKPDLSGVIAIAHMGPKTEPLLREATRFWVVRPRIGLGGVSGLGTLLSGAYLELDPGREGVESRSFVALEVPPQTPMDAPGLKIALDADALGSVGLGSPVSHHGFTVGKVEGYHLVDDEDSLRIDIYIDPEYASHVRADSRFWNASGIDVSFGAEGLKFSASSLVSLLSGGVEFDTPAGEATSKPAVSGAVYRLYADRTASREVFTRTRDYVAYFTGSVRGLSAGAPVEFRGLRLGTVVSFELVQTDLADALVRVVIAIEPQRLGIEFREEEPPEKLLATMVGDGLRAQLASGSLLTGALLVDIIFDKNAPPILHGKPGELEVPTVPSTTDQLKVAMDAIPEIMEAAQRAVTSVAEIAESADIRAAASAARSTLERADSFFASISKQLAAQSSLQLRLAETLDELAASMRSVRQLADTIDRQPESLIRGKDDPGDR
jgi:paraquat-inducible protein B